MRIMKKLTLIASCVALLLSSCAHEYNQVLKSGDYTCLLYTSDAADE